MKPEYVMNKKICAALMRRYIKIRFKQAACFLANEKQRGALNRDFRKESEQSMIKRITPFMLVLIILVFSGCENKPETAAGDLPPMIDMAGQKYIAPYMPVDELPEGYTYMGELTEAQANDTGLEGCKMYAVTELDSIPDFYLYQECGTPVDDNTVDSEKIQWAYVQWIQVKEE